MFYHNKQNLLIMSIQKGDTVIFNSLCYNPYKRSYGEQKFVVKNIIEIKKNTKISLSMGVFDLAERALKKGKKFFVVEFEKHPIHSTLYPILYLKKV